MELLFNMSLGLFAFLPSILLLFGIYLIWEQSKLVNKQLDGIAQLLAAIHSEQQRVAADSRHLGGGTHERHRPDAIQ